jgi:hypothetical protein
VRQLVRLMDGAFVVPGTGIKLGLDPIIGFFLPGLGDVLTAIPALLLLTLAVQRGVPTVIVLRMLLNIATDALLGAIPILGDVFDVVYRANEKNLALLEAHAGAMRSPRPADYAIVALAIALLGALALLPFLVVASLIKLLVS